MPVNINSIVNCITIELKSKNDYKKKTAISLELDKNQQEVDKS